MSAAGLVQGAGTGSGMPAIGLRRALLALEDGAQQRLVGVALRLRLLQNRIRAAPERAATFVTAVSDEVAQSLEELRELARGLADRVEALDGRLQIVSPAGAGTVVTAELPCAP
jgi:signal transduction histidine kinase